VIKGEHAAARQVLEQAVPTRNRHASHDDRGSAHPYRAASRLAAAPKCCDCGARHSGICDAMPEADLNLLAAAAVIVRKQPGQRFIDEGDDAVHFFTMSEGTARILKTLADGRQQLVSFASRGDFLGLAVSSHYAYSVEAVDPVAYCRFSRPALRALLIDFPDMEARLLDITCHELVLAQEQMLLLGRKSARERVASFLILRISRSSTETADLTHGIPVSLPMTRSDIADYLGLRIETVSRTLSRMKVDGLIHADASAHGVVITNLAALDACAAGG
jgi:CRP/FNR family transcriptional regulator